MLNRLLFFLLIANSSCIFGQVVKVDGGVNIGKFANSEKLPILNSNLYTYSVKIGLDYMEHEKYYLSSQIGYTTLGGKEVNMLLEDPDKEISEKWNFVEVNTTFRYKFPIKGSHVFIGAGPKMNFLIDSSKFNSWIYDGYEINKVNIGAKTELGYAVDINHLRAGFVSSYNFDFTPIGGTKFIDLKNTSFSLIFSLGYRL